MHNIVDYMTITEVAGTVSPARSPANPQSDVPAELQTRPGADRQRERTRTPRLRHYAMTAPTFFTVEYAINPWMDADTPVDAGLAVRQWEVLRHTYESLGHTV